MRREIIQPAAEQPGGDIQGLPIRHADRAMIEDHGASIWAVCYVRRIVNGQAEFTPTEIVAFPREDFLVSLMGAIAKMLPDKGQPMHLDS